MRLSREAEDRKFDREYDGILNPWAIENADADVDEEADQGDTEED